MRFRELGHWQQIEKGRLNYEVDYYPHYHSVARVYDEVGKPTELILTHPLLVHNDTVVEEQIIYLDLFNRADTLAVQHIFHSPERKQVSEPTAFWSYDAAGRQPVPAGWKFRRC